MLTLSIYHIWTALCKNVPSGIWDSIRAVWSRHSLYSNRIIEYYIIYNGEQRPERYIPQGDLNCAHVWRHVFIWDGLYNYFRFTESLDTTECMKESKGQGVTLHMRRMIWICMFESTFPWRGLYKYFLYAFTGCFSLTRSIIIAHYAKSHLSISQFFTQIYRLFPLFFHNAIRCIYSFEGLAEHHQHVLLWDNNKKMFILDNPYI